MANHIVDSNLLIFFICIFARAIINKWGFISPYIIACILFIMIYIVATTWRVGTAMDLLNEYVTDEQTRKNLGLNPWSLRNRPVKRDIVTRIFRIAFIVASTIIFITQIVLK